MNDERRAELHAELDRLIERGEEFATSAVNVDDAGAHRVDVEGRLLVRSALDLAAAAAGECAHAHAIGANSTEPAPVRISRCLTLLSRFIDPNCGMTPSVEDFALELRALAAGDAPRVLALAARTKGKPTNAYRRLSFQLRALEWEALLEMLGMAAEQRQSMVSIGYGKPWDTISRWRSACAEGLGKNTTAVSLYLARVTASEWVGSEGIELQARIDHDGAAYRRELATGARIKAVPSE